MSLTLPIGILKHVHRLLPVNSLQPMQRINSINGKKMHQSIATVFSHEDGLFEAGTLINPNSAYKGNHRHEVNLRQNTCSYQKWQAYKISCSHVIVVCKYQGISAM